MALTYVIIILTLIWYSWLLFKHFTRSQYPMPPGPRGLPVVGNLPYLDPELHSYFARLARIYGPILSLNLGTKKAIVITSPALAREVLKEHDVTFANRDMPSVNTAMEYSGHDIVFTPYGPEWRMLRKVCVRDMLGNATLDAFYSYRRHEVRSTVKYFYSLAGSPVNVGEQMFLNMLNVVTNMLWGGSVKGNERASIGAEFRQVVSEITELLGKPNVSDFFPGLAWLDLQGMKKKMKKVTVKLERIFDEIIEQRVKWSRSNGGEMKRDFLQVLMQLKDEGKDSKTNKTPFTMLHVKALLVVRTLAQMLLVYFHCAFVKSFM